MKNSVYDSSKKFSISQNIRDVIHNPKLIWTISIIDLKLKYKKSILGPLWSLLNPLFTSLIVFFVFGRIFTGYLPGDGSYFFMVFSGFTLLIFLIQGIPNTANAMNSYLPVVLNYRLNPLIAAQALGLAQALSFLIASSAVVLTGILFTEGISARVFLIPLFIFFCSLFISGISMILFHYYRRFDDAAYLFNVLIMIITYLSPFFYPIDALGNRTRLLVELNPMTSFILTYRWLIESNSHIDIINILVVVFGSIVLYVMGLFHMRCKWNETVML